MKAKVTDAGVLIPKDWFEGAQEVEIRRQPNVILILPIKSTDPILNLGKNPVSVDVSDASENHDRYLYHP